MSFLKNMCDIHQSPSCQLLSILWKFFYTFIFSVVMLFSNEINACTLNMLNIEPINWNNLMWSHYWRDDIQHSWKFDLNLILLSKGLHASAVTPDLLFHNFWSACISTFSTARLLFQIMHRGDSLSFVVANICQFFAAFLGDTQHPGCLEGLVRGFNCRLPQAGSQSTLWQEAQSTEESNRCGEDF